MPEDLKINVAVGGAAEAAASLHGLAAAEKEVLYYAGGQEYVVAKDQMAKTAEGFDITRREAISLTSALSQLGTVPPELRMGFARLLSGGLTPAAMGMTVTLIAVQALAAGMEKLNAAAEASIRRMQELAQAAGQRAAGVSDVIRARGEMTPEGEAAAVAEVTELQQAGIPRYEATTLLETMARYAPALGPAERSEMARAWAARTPALVKGKAYDDAKAFVRRYAKRPAERAALAAGHRILTPGQAEQAGGIGVASHGPMREEERVLESYRNWIEGAEGADAQEATADLLRAEGKFAGVWDFLRTYAIPAETAYRYARGIRRVSRFAREVPGVEYTFHGGVHMHGQYDDPAGRVPRPDMR